MRRFLVPQSLVAGSTVLIDGGLYRHMARVLRLHPGDEVILCNGKGVDYHATVQGIGSKTVSLVISDIPPEGGDNLSATPHITLIQALPKGDKCDYIIQKAAELGVQAIMVFPAAHSVARISGDQIASRISRWNKIAVEAARQCERRTIPPVSFSENLDAALHDTAGSVKLLLWERETDATLRELLSGMERPARVVILVGPEGGFSPHEVCLAKTHCFIPVSLGPRILRTETASLAMLAILQYQWGDIG